jgi:quercetin dioxygenase-like cupin family protein
MLRVMGWTFEPGTVTRAEAEAALIAEGGAPVRSWANGPGDRYGIHEHGYHKVLFCLEGSITFHTGEGDVEMTAGDRLDLTPATPHGATVGPHGCMCLEASR